MKTILDLNSPEATLETVGGKGESLSILLNANLPVPEGFAITTTAYHQFVEHNQLHQVIAESLKTININTPKETALISQKIQKAFWESPFPEDLRQQINAAFTAFPSKIKAVAVRSSATAEDLPDASFAGQQDSFLNITGFEELLDAVKKCWASLWNARAIAYRLKQNIPTEKIALSVIVQALIPAEFSGIMFTANPITGNKAEILINAAWGLGEAIVGGLVNPDCLIINKKERTITGREIAQKLKMTIRTTGGTQEQDVPQELISTPVLGDQQALVLAELALKIENLYQQFMDIEWAYAAGEFYILQARPITTLPVPIQPEDLLWTPPEPKAQYARVSITELMPDPLSPLFATMALPIISDSIGKIMEEHGKTKRSALPDPYIDLINGYAYQSMNFTPKQMLMMFSALIPMTIMIMKEILPYWINTGLPEYKNTVRQLDKNPQGMPSTQIMKHVETLVEAYAEHLAILMEATMGVSAGSEGLFTKVYEKLIQKAGDPPATSFLMGFESKPLQAEKDLFNLGVWVSEQKSLSSRLLNSETSQITYDLQNNQKPEEISEAVWVEFIQKITKHNQEYGYAVYTLDFQEALPMEKPEVLVSSIKQTLAGHGKDPHQRQEKLRKQREEAEARIYSRNKRGFKHWAFDKSLRWAQKQAPMRENGLAEAGFAYPVIRKFLAELGFRFVNSGLIKDQEDIYFMEYDEVKQYSKLVDQSSPLISINETILYRKTLQKKRGQMSPPPKLPEKTKFLGVNMDGLMAIQSDNFQGNEIKGIGSSSGKITARARVLHDTDDFERLHSGEILVAKITTPAWTPLFSLAGGIITDIGGPLSHGSIVAREYGIPAVLGTGVATQVIQDGQTLTLDGDQGLIILHPLESA